MKKINILIDGNIPLLPEVLEEYADIKIFNGRELCKDDLLKFHCKMLFTRSTTEVNEFLLEGTPVRFVATATSGSEHFDKEYLASKGIVFFDALGSNAMSVAEYIIFGILEWSKRRGIDLTGKKLGIIGFGNVGRRVARFAQLIGLDIIANDPPLSDMGFEFPEYVTYLELDELLAKSDIITVHTPLSNVGKYKTFNLLNSSNMKLIKSEALLLQASRGGVVEENVWIQYAKEGRIDVIADVFEREPNVSTNAMQTAMIATPHVAGHAFDGKLKGSLMMAQAFQKFTGIEPKYEIITNMLDEARKLELSKICSKELYSKLRKSRNILDLHREFIALIGRGDLNKGFDLMRKNYPLQREIFPE